MADASQILEVGESGEFKRGTLGESKESYKVKTYGRVVAITRQVLINDDLDAFTRIDVASETAWYLGASPYAAGGSLPVNGNVAPACACASSIAGRVRACWSPGGD